MTMLLPTALLQTDTDTRKPQTPRLTAAEYLRCERLARDKSEFFDGKVVPMAGASRKHNTIQANGIRLLGNALEDTDHEVYGSDMRVYSPRTNSFTYPDLSVTAIPPVFQDGHLDVLLNPIVVVEILSDSTKGTDFGDKRTGYQQIATLREYLLVAQDRPFATLFRRDVNSEDWPTELEVVSGLDAVITLQSVGCELPMARLYHKVAGLGEA